MSNSLVLFRLAKCLFIIICINDVIFKAHFIFSSLIFLVLNLNMLCKPIIIGSGCSNAWVINLRRFR